MLFLGAGSVIHGMHHEQDMRNYGGLRHKMPKTFWAMMIGTLAITGVGIPFSYDLVGVPIGFAGFVSKDAIIESSYAAGAVAAFWLVVVAALMTSFYSWRLMFLTFYGEPRGDRHTHEHAHESPNSMLIPLGALAVGSVLAGMVWHHSFFGHTDEVARFYGIPYADESAAAGEGAEAADGAGEGAEDGAEAAAGYEHHYVFTGQPGEGALFIAPENTVLEDAHDVPGWVKLSPFVAMLAGLGLAWLFYIRQPSLPGQLAQQQRHLYRFLLNKWYFDELYDAVFVRPARGAGELLWRRGDGSVIDGGINGLAMGIVPFFARLAGRAQSGYLFHYAFAMVLGIVLIVTWLVIRGGS
jgi:NADH-quinone oxidoreductase subunit L